MLKKQFKKIYTDGTESDRKILDGYSSKVISVGSEDEENLLPGHETRIAGVLEDAGCADKFLKKVLVNNPVTLARNRNKIAKKIIQAKLDSLG